MATTKAPINADIPLKQIKKLFPDLDKLLKKIGYAPIVSMIGSMSDPSNISLSNIARAAGLTEIEIVLITEELNDSLDQNKPKIIKKVVKTKAKTKVKAKSKVKSVKSKVKAKTKKSKRNAA